MELTNNLRKLIASLSERKFRKREALFKAEGTKCVCDTIGHFSLFALMATDAWFNSHPEIIAQAGDLAVKCKPTDIQRMSDLSTASEVIAVYHTPDYGPFHASADSLIIALDDIQDPGNLGTIIRTADWFGISDIICSQATADCFSPKVVQATMGAISRVKVHYLDLQAELSELAKRIPVYGTFLDGHNIYTSDLKRAGVIVMGNEGRGISDRIAALVTDRLLIPSFGKEGDCSESLNVAVAAAITVSEFLRRTF